MATISYKCDTCKRKVELVENPQGFTVVGKCVITNGCTGRLYKTERNPNNVRESSPSYVEGLNNYVPRRAFYQFSQTLSSDKWKVEHDMGVLPSTFVYLIQPDGSYIQQDNSAYTVTAIDKNTILITFPTKVKGIVQCVAKSTVPLVPSTIPESDQLFQVSTNGVITFAVPKFLTQANGTIPPVSPPAITPTLTPSPTPTSTPYNLPLNLCSSSSVIQIEIEITKPNEDPFVCFEDVPNFTDNRSPWTGWGELLVSNRRNYCMRTVSLLKLNVFGNAELKASDIPNGTRIRFLRIDYGTGRKEEIPSRGLLMLLSKSPYENVDKVKDRLVDVGELIGDNPDYFVYNNGELFLDQSKLEKTYPDIARVVFKAAPPQPSPTPTPTITPTLTATISVTPTLTITPTISTTAEISATPTPTITVSPTVTPSATPELPYDGEEVPYLILSPSDPNNNSLIYAEPTFDDSTWLTGFGAFGGIAPSGSQIVRTAISGQCDRRLWLRQKIEFPPTGQNLRVDIWRDDGAQFWWNGVQLPTIQTSDYFAIYAIVPASMITGDDLAALRVTDCRNDADNGPLGSANIYASMSFAYSTDPLVSWTPTPTATKTPLPTPTITPTISVTPTVTHTVTPTISVTPTITPSATGIIPSFQPRSVVGIHLPNAVTTISSIDNFNGNYYIAHRNSLNKSKISILDSGFSNVTDAPNIPTLPGGFNTYTGLYNHQGSELLVSRSGDGSHPLYSYNTSNTLTSIATITVGVQSNFITVLDDKISTGISIGSFSGDGYIFCDYTGTLGANVFQKNTNYNANSGQGLITVKYNGEYYGAGTNNPYLTKFNNLTSGSTTSSVNTGLTQTPTEGIANGIATDGTSLIVVPYKATNTTNASAYSVFDGTSWTVKNISAGNVFVGPLLPYNNIDGNLFVVTKNASTKDLSIYNWNNTTQEFDFGWTLPSMSTVNATMTDWWISSIRWVGDSVFLVGTCIISTGNSGLIIELSK